MINPNKLQSAPTNALLVARRNLQRKQILCGALGTKDSLRMLAVTAELDRRHRNA